MYRKCHVFLHFFTSSSQSKPAKNTGIYKCFDKTTCKKTRCFETIVHNFSAHAPPFKIRSFFTLLLPPLIRTQEGVKSGQIAKLHLNSTFWSYNFAALGEAAWAPKCCSLRCFMNVPCIVPAKHGAPPPQLKLTVLVPPERHAFLHLRCGRICGKSGQEEIRLMRQSCSTRLVIGC